MFQKIRSSKITKAVVFLFVLHFLGGYPIISSLLATDPPSRPQMRGPSAVTYDNFVDPFTGDFHYSIPLFDVGDIPLTINYNAGATMDEESSWVGLGWSLNPGSITRSVRGLPDDFKGDDVVSETNMKDNVTSGVSIEGAFELFGLDKIKKVDAGINLSLGISIVNNSYKGWSIETSVSPSFVIQNYGSLGITMQGESGSFGDLGYHATVSNGGKSTADGKFPFSIGINGNSKEGIKGLTLYGNQNQIRLGNFPAELFVDQSHIPMIQPSFINSSFTANGAFGGVPIFGADVDVEVTSFNSIQQLSELEKEKHSHAYGYLHLDNSVKGNVLMDFNRLKDEAIKENSPYLPASYLTYDIYSINSPGVSGTFRPYRNDMGYIQETPSVSISNGATNGFEVSAGATVDPGLNYTSVEVNSWSGSWAEFIEEPDNLDPDSKALYNSEVINNSKDRAVYFAMTHEMSISEDNNFINSEIGGKEAVKYRMPTEAHLAGILSDQLVDNGGEEYVSDDYFQNGRNSQVTSITYLTIDEQEIHPTLETGAAILSKRHFINPSAQGHHIGKIIVTTSDGTRYVYGLPVYNTKQKEVTFSVGQSSMGAIKPVTNDNRDLVHYQDDQSSTDNYSGVDNYYNAINTPAYAYEFLLTEILSPNYMDITGNGVTADDYGSYVVYNYGIPDDDDSDGIPDFQDPDGDEEGDRLYKPNIENYKWRTPTVEEDYDGDAIIDRKWASYQEGLKSNYSDDRANYVYGEKEVWYLFSIETKHYYAECHLSDRSDALGSIDEKGGVETGVRLQKLDRIELYSKMDQSYYLYSQATLDTDDDVNLHPVKTIHFVYDYSLCEGVPNRTTDPLLEGDGKLTLKKVYFTYNGSSKAAYSPYEFEYDPETNYGYNAQAYDRWGHYMPNDFPTTRPNHEFPYVDQSDVNNDDYAAAWCMTEIYTPSGGKIVIDYESDDYSYIQDKSVAEMYPIVGFSDTHDGEVRNRLYETYEVVFGDEHIRQNYFLFFDLPDDNFLDGLTQADANDLIRDKCIHEIGSQDIYFRVLTNSDDDLEVTPGDYDFDEGVGETLTTDEKPEYVSGYAKVDYDYSNYAGAVKEGDHYTKGYLKLRSRIVKITEDGGTDLEINPITKAAWQFCMANTTYNILNEDPIPADMTIGEIADRMADASFFDAISSLYNKPNDILFKDGFGKLIEPNRSIVRLGSLKGQKDGGGHRVKSVIVYDNWDQMTSDEDGFSYGFEYSYVSGRDGKSSGVASYEPLYGGDEISLRLPQYFDHEDVDYQYGLYYETPLCEQLYPSPVVGYSRVVMKSISRENVKANATGKTIYSYYTAYDFPIKVDFTINDPILFEPDPVVSLFQKNYVNKYTSSQGYAVEINDMHGKLKSVEVFAETDDNGGTSKLVSSQRYTYFTEDGTVKQLSNSISTIDPNGSISNDVELGVTYDISADFRKQVTTSSTHSLSAGLDLTTIGIIGLIAFNIINYNHSGYESCEFGVVTKIISRKGILKEVETEQDGSRVVQKNLYFDSRTGSPILTSMQNEFDDTYYSFNYPAHWVYTGMGSAIDNIDYSFKSDATLELINTEGKVIGSPLLDVIIPGDEIYGVAFFTDAASGEAFYKYYDSWIYRANTGAAIGDAGYYLIDQNGGHTTFEEGDANLLAIYGRIVRSGSRNFVGASVGSVTTKRLPINALGTELEIDESKGIISASGLTFSDVWQKLCDYDGGYTTTCSCTYLPTEEGVQFTGLMQALFGAEKFLADLTEVYDGTVSPALYYYDFTPLLYDKVGSEAETVIWDADPFYEDGAGDLLLPIQIMAPQPSCDFKINFGTATESEVVAALNNPSDWEMTIVIPDDPSVECEEIREFTLHLTNGATTIEGVCEYLDCLTLRHCSEESNFTTYCTGGPGDIVNPYVVGVLGKWAPKQSYMYKANREYTYTVDEDPSTFAGSYTNIRNDGEYADFTPFWNFVDDYWEPATEIWQPTSEGTLMNPYAGATEAMDALGLYSSTDFGYNNSLPLIVGRNAAYQELAFENFEDDPLNILQDKACNPEHFGFSGIATFKYAHTGTYSKEIPPVTDNVISYEYPLTDHLDEHLLFEKDFEITLDDCLPAFSPFEEEAQTYIVTMWILEESEDYLASYEELGFSATIPGYTITTTEKLGAMVDGWQHTTYTFSIPSGASGDLLLSFTNTGENSIFVDDIRIEPVDGMSTCFVYDMRTQRLMAELDENHFATLYEYDEDGQLIRIKKETEKGIMTIQEGRYSSVKRN